MSMDEALAKITTITTQATTNNNHIRDILNRRNCRRKTTT